MSLKVRINDLNLWSKRSATWRTMLYFTFGTMYWTILVTMLMVILGTPREIADSAFAFGGFGGFAVSLPTALRTRILKRWVARKNFDWLCRLQTIASTWLKISTILVMVMLVAIVYSVFRNPTVVSYEFAMVSAIVLVSNPINTSFADIFTSQKLAILLMKNYSLQAKNGTDVDRRQLSRGLSIFEGFIRRYGIQFSQEKIALAINTSLLRGLDYDSYLENFSAALANPTKSNIANAVDSAAQALGIAKKDLDSGLEIPYSRWRRLMIPSNLEFASNAIYLTIGLVSAVFLLLGFHVGQ